MEQSKFDLDRMREVALKLDVNQYARNEVAITKAELRDALQTEVTSLKEDIKVERRKVWGVAVALLAILVGGDIWAVDALRQKMLTALDDEVNRSRKAVEKSLMTETRSMQVEIHKRLAKEFEAPHLKELIGSEARRYTATEAKDYIASQVEAGLKPFRMQVEHAEADLQRFRTGQTNYEKQYNSDYAKLSKTIAESEKLAQTLSAQVQILKRRNEVSALRVDAISSGNRASLDALNRIIADPKEEQDIKQMALSEALGVKSFWVSADRTKAWMIDWRGRDGKSKSESQLTTCELLDNLRNSPTWQVRAKAADLLAGHRKLGVPDALLRTIRNDPQLHVARDAVNAFVQITGYQTVDVLGLPFIEDWWKENAEAANKKLSKLDCTP